MTNTRSNKPYTTTELGMQVRNYRLEHHISQGALADQLYVTPNTIHLWERKGRVPSMVSLYALSDLFGEPFPVILRKSRNRCQVCEPEHTGRQEYVLSKD